MEKRKFIFNTGWQEILLDYPAEVRLEVYDAVIRYAATGTLSDLKPMAKMAFSFIKNEIDYNNGKYSDIIRKRSDAGKKGGGNPNFRKGEPNPYYSKDKNDKQTLSDINKDKQTLSDINKINYNDNVYDNVYDNDFKEKDNSIELSKKKPGLSQDSGLEGTPLETGRETLSPCCAAPPPPGNRRRFVPPTIAEVGDYIRERGYRVDAERFWNFYESKGWMVGRNKMKDWHAAVATWETTEDGRKNGGQYGDNRKGSENRRGSLKVMATRAEDYKTTF